MRRCVSMRAAGVALAAALTGCGGSVPGLSGLGGSDNVLLQGTVFGSGQKPSSRARQVKPSPPWDMKALRNHAPNPTFSLERTASTSSGAVAVREVTFETEPVTGTPLSLFGGTYKGPAGGWSDPPSSS